MENQSPNREKINRIMNFPEKHGEDLDSTTDVIFLNILIIILVL